jgi:hypothetical protein
MTSDEKLYIILPSFMEIKNMKANPLSTLLILSLRVNCFDREWLRADIVLELDEVTVQRLREKSGSK